MNLKRIFPAIPVRKHYFLKYLTGIITCLFLVTMVTCSPANAFGRSGGRIPEGRSADQITSDMKEHLNLTEEQEAQIRPIIEEQIEKRREIVQKYQGHGRPDRESLRNEMQKLRETTENQLAGILTEDQMEEYRGIQEEQRQKMHEERQQNMRRGGRGARGGMGGRGGMSRGF